MFLEVVHQHLLSCLAPQHQRPCLYRQPQRSLEDWFWVGWTNLEEFRQQRSIAASKAVNKELVSIPHGLAVVGILSTAALRLQLSARNKLGWDGWFVFECRHRLEEVDVSLLPFLDLLFLHLLQDTTLVGIGLSSGGGSGLKVLQD